MNFLNQLLGVTKQVSGANSHYSVTDVASPIPMYAAMLVVVAVGLLAGFVVIGIIRAMFGRTSRAPARLPGVQGRKGISPPTGYAFGPPPGIAPMKSPVRRAFEEQTYTILGFDAQGSYTTRRQSGSSRFDAQNRLTNKGQGLSPFPPMGKKKKW